MYLSRSPEGLLPLVLFPCTYELDLLLPPCFCFYHHHADDSFPTILCTTLHSVPFVFLSCGASMVPYDRRQYGAV